MATAADNGRAHRRLARREALLCMAAKGAIIISDLRDWCHARGLELDWEKPWTGSLFQHEWFQYTGNRRAAHHGASNARKVNEYCLSVAGRDELAKLSGGRR